MKQSLRFFSLGLLVSALLLFGFNFFFEGSDSISNASVDDLKAALHEEGYRVVSEEDYVTYTLKKDEAQNKSDEASKDEAEETDKKDIQESTKNTDKKEDKDEKADKKKEDKEKEDKDKVVKATIKTKAGVVSPEIADDLVDKKIIKKNERDKFVKYLDDNGYSEYIQLGTFKVNSDMNFKELAETVTTYPGD